MLFHSVNFNELKIFESVYRKKSMTLAAEELNITQSGVSQHISALEESLGFRLFDRIKRKIIPTPQARDLYESCKASFDLIEGTLYQLKGSDRVLSGTLSIGMPQQFGANILSPLISEFGTRHPLVKFELHFLYSQNILPEILNGRLDIGFIDEFYTNDSLEHQSVYTETLELVIQKKLYEEISQSPEDRKYFENLPMVDYEFTNPLCLKWFKHHFKSERIKPQFRAFVPSTGGVASMIAAGLGAGILPRHVTRLIHASTPLHRYTGKSKKPITNAIHLARLKNRTPSLASAALHEFLIQKLEQFQPVGEQ